MRLDEKRDLLSIDDLEDSFSDIMEWALTFKSDTNSHLDFHSDSNFRRLVWWILHIYNIILSYHIIISCYHIRLSYYHMVL